MWLVGVVSRRWVWLVGGIYGYGYNVKVWLLLVGVVIRRYIDILIIIINFPYSTCIRSFFGSSILTPLFILKCFFGLYCERSELPSLFNARAVSIYNWRAERASLVC